jgi:hypothetical protein
MDGRECPTVMKFFEVKERRFYGMTRFEKVDDADNSENSGIIQC